MLLLLTGLIQGHYGMPIWVSVLNTCLWITGTYYMAIRPGQIR